MVVSKIAYQKKKVLKAKENVEIFEKLEFIHYIYALDEFAGRFLCKVSELLKLIYLCYHCKTFEFDTKVFSEIPYRWRKGFFPPIFSF